MAKTETQRAQTCIECGEDFKSLNSIKRKYCSPQCYYKNIKPKPKTGKFFKCVVCSKEVWREPYRFTAKKTFCSLACLNKFDFEGILKLKCKNCGEEYERSRSAKKWRGSSYCSIPCRKDYLKKNMVLRKAIGKTKNSTLKKQLWTYFSRYIRQRDGGVCISCGKVDSWKNTDAGHYIPKTAGLSIYFDERNVNCQCTGCNRFKHGNLSNYAIAIMEKYGDSILVELDNERRKIRKIDNQEYVELIEKYKRKIQEAGYSFS